MNHLKKPRATILAIGTELTTGQTLNSNGSWISKQIQSLELQTHADLAVPDEREDIIEALNFLAPQSDVMFVLGGLGPTNDDLTRYILAEWSEQKLVFSDEAWDHVQQRLNEKKVQIKPIQRRVCEFPEKSELLINRNGTACGYLFFNPMPIFVLPGPPIELQGIFNEFVFKKLLDQFGPNQTQLLLWQCVGKPESEIAEISERLIRSPRLKLGYRLHRPYVELKIWAPLEMNHEEKMQIAAMEEELKDHISSRGPWSESGQKK